jgi:hypothetical protein
MKIILNDTMRRDQLVWRNNSWKIWNSVCNRDVHCTQKRIMNRSIRFLFHDGGIQVRGLCPPRVTQQCNYQVEDDE